MTKRKTPLLVPEFSYGIEGKKLSIGEITLQMAQNFLLERIGNVNQLSLSAIMDREKEFISQVNVAFAEQVAREVAAHNRGKGGARAKKVRGDKTKENVRTVIASLNNDGKKVTAYSIATRWGRVIVPKEKESSQKLHPTEKQIKKYLDEIKSELP